MTDLAAAALTLRPVERCTIPRWTGPQFRAWFLEQIGRHDPALAETLQTGETLRPYTISTLLNTGRSSGGCVYLTPDQSYILRITTLYTPLTRLILDHLLPNVPGQVVQIGEALLHFDSGTARSEDHEGAGITTDAVLIQQHTLHTGVLPASLELDFRSPTGFRNPHGMFTPFPLPALVFGSLINRWNEFNEVRLHPDTRRFAEECIEVRRHRIHTDRVVLEMAGQASFLVGFQGQCSYSILRGDRYWRGVVYTLAEYAFYAGVGAHTTMGLGQVRPRQPRQNAKY